MNNQNQETISTCVCCDLPAEWVDKWCQECWEAECDRTWWEMVILRGGIELNKPKYPQT
jgi:hypothetical protein